MRDIITAKTIFDKYGGIMRTSQLTKEKIFYADIVRFLKDGHIEKIRNGYYQWIDHENLSEATMIKSMFPDGILCMDTALRHYGYSDRTPGEWHIAVSQYTSPSRFKIDYPFVKPYYTNTKILNLGVCEQAIDGITVKMYDRDRVICDCLRNRNKMDKELFNKAIQGYIADSSKNIPKLMEYAKPLRCVSLVKNLIGIWL